MRIISGKYKGRQINPPRNLPVRPTTDFAKTGLFNILENRFDLQSLDCLDLFSGTGSISLELISRGCRHVTAVDRDHKCVEFLKSTAAQLSIHNLTVFRSDVMVFVTRARQAYDLVFADPPFDLGIHEKLHAAVFNDKLLKPGGVFILEHASRDRFDHFPGFNFTKKYGNVSFTFFTTLESSLHQNSQ